MRNETEESVLELLGNLSGSPVTDLSVKLADDLALDSLRMVTLLILLEDTFEIELDESDMNPFQLITAADVAALAQKYQEPAQEHTHEADEEDDEHE